MTDLLAHRGPDDEGFWDGGEVALGHRRLSIIDLSTRGRNPMPSWGHGAWIVFNGEIYNFRQLRSDLERQGYCFRSGTDTEVIVNLYDRYGPDCIAMLDGMFAFAIWDLRQRRLVLARDRYGVKPLYITRVGGVLAFASEIKAFTALPGFRPRLDPVGLSQHLSFQNMLGARTLFQGVDLLEAGHFAIVSDGTLTRQRYWDLELDPEYAVPLVARTERLRDVFAEAVKRQLVSDVPVGSYLSGGMDTGSIAAVAARHIAPLHTFTCGFDIPSHASDEERLFDERAESWELARALGTKHHVLTLGADAMKPVLPNVIWHLDEPRVGISYQVYYTARRIREDVEVVLSGVGGDELFAGYPWRYAAAMDRDGPAFDEAYYQASCRLLSDDEKSGLLSEPVMRDLSGYTPRDDFQAILDNSGTNESLDRALYADFKIFLNGLLLVDDKLSMAHSVEARVPFLDNALVDEARHVPAAWRLENGEGKAILRRAMRGLLPETTTRRRKQGFTPPDAAWYRGASLAAINELILGERALDRGLFRPDAVATIVEDHVAGRRNHRFLIWSLMCLEWWHRLFVDGERPAGAAIARSRETVH